MSSLSLETPSFSARWTSRIALFSVGVLTCAFVLHRLFSMPTPVAFNLGIVAFAGAGLSLLLACFAAIGIWRTGRPGTSRVVFGTLVSLALVSWPLVYLPNYEQLPNINDITTDPVTPPSFGSLAASRGPSTNGTGYAGQRYALQQAAAYPDIKPILINRSSEEAYELAADAVRRLKLDVKRQKAPDADKQQPGVLEIVDRTMIAGFYDDVVIRVAGNDESARIDVRSASRFGRHDLGRNAERARLILTEIVTRLEAVVPTAKPKAEPEKAEKKKSVKRRSRRSRRSRRRRR